jgi:hypothetical protein
MRWNVIWDAISAVNLVGLRLAISDQELSRSYVSRCLQIYDDVAGRGLPSRDPVEHVMSRGWGVLSPSQRLEVPALLHDGGGTRLDELLYLAAVTRALQPRKIFEIGTFNGRTTSVFILNAAADSTIMTLDLPPESTLNDEQRVEYIDTDVTLVRRRTLASVVLDQQLESRCEQILCDSMQFDPAPYAGTVELGFIDGGHALHHVKNDTRKMAVMMAEDSLVLWHDYGGKGRFRDLTSYLECIGRHIPVFRVPGTTLAWAEGAALRTLMA